MCRVDVSLIFKNVRRRKKVYNKSKSEEIPKDHFSAILEVSQVLSSSLTTINQMFLTNNKRALSRFCGTVALTTEPRFYLLKVKNRNIKNTRASCEMFLELTERAPE